MGNSIDKGSCVLLSELPQEDWDLITGDSYTVQRNPKKGGEPLPGEPGAAEDEGWVISSNPHGIYCDSRDDFEAHATNQYNGRNGLKQWKFFMRNGSRDPNTHACGWRTCEAGKRTFWPTRLKTQEEREEWWAWLDERVSTLQTPQQKKKKRGELSGLQDNILSSDV